MRLYFRPEQCTRLRETFSSLEHSWNRWMRRKRGCCVNITRETKAEGLRHNHGIPKASRYNYRSPNYGLVHCQEYCQQKDSVSFGGHQRQPHNIAYFLYLCQLLVPAYMGFVGAWMSASPSGMEHCKVRVLTVKA